MNAINTRLMVIRRVVHAVDVRARGDAALDRTPLGLRSPVQAR